MRKAASIALGERSGSMYRAAKKVPITAAKLMRPRPSVTGSISTKTRFTAGSRQSIATRSRPSSPVSQGKGRSNCTTVPSTIEPA